jgi:hypothetical protein
VIAVLAVLLCSALRSCEKFAQELLRQWMTILAACALIAAGLFLRNTPPQNASFAAKSVADFGGFLLACLSWPSRPMILLALVTWMPFAVIVANYLRC